MEMYTLNPSTGTDGAVRQFLMLAAHQNHLESFETTQVLARWWWYVFIFFFKVCELIHLTS